MLKFTFYMTRGSEKFTVTVNNASELDRFFDKKNNLFTIKKGNITTIYNASFICKTVVEETNDAESDGNKNE